MATTIKVTFDSLTQAAEALQRLMMRLDSHQMYTSAFKKSEGACRDSISTLMDEMNTMKTDLGRIIDGTRNYLIEVNSEFAQADEEAKKRIWELG